MAPPLLTLQDIHLTFGGTPLLEGAELSIGERERVCLVGRNGSGKSTLLKIAAGLAEADRGVTRRIERGFASFEEWRDQVLEEEEREQHKLGRKIVAEEHWMRYGVTARRKRNMRRVGELGDLRKRFREHHGAQGSVKIAI